MKNQISKHDAVVSALPYFLNKPIAQLAHDEGKHYFVTNKRVEFLTFNKKTKIEIC